MNETIHEPGRDVPVLDEVDVLVVGGGVSGCAAAWAAGQAGARTLLLERNGCLGGVATATLMANIGNLFLTADGRQVIHGVAGLVVDRLVRAGGASPQWASREVPGCVIDSERLKLVLLELLTEANVTCLTHVLGAKPILEDTRVTGVFVEGKSGRQAIRARTVVDCTGEADIAWQAGADVSFCQGSASTLFKLANVDLDAFVDFLGCDPEGFPVQMDMTRDYPTFARNWKERGILFFPHGGGSKWRFLQRVIEDAGFACEAPPAFHLDALGMYGLRGTGFVVINSNFYRIEDLDVRKLAAFELHAHRMCYYVADFLQQNVPGFGRAAVAHVGVDLGVRVSRIARARNPVDSRSYVRLDASVHAPDVVGVQPIRSSEWRDGTCFSDSTFDIPFGLLVPVGCQGLLLGSGKCVDIEPRGKVRGMTGCMLCGQAAGAACALAADAGIDPAQSDITALQRELLSQGVHLGTDDRLAELGL